MNKDKEVSLKFLIRRIEHDIEKEVSLQHLMELLDTRKATLDLVVKTIDNDILYRVDVLNLIAIRCFELKQFDYIIPLLRKALEYEPSDHDTLYNLAYVLMSFEIYEEASSVLSNILVPSEASVQLDEYVKGKMINAK